MKDGDPMLRWMARGFVAGGAVCLLGGALGAWWRSATESHAPRYPGIVAEVRVGQRYPREDAIVRFTPAGGAERSFRNPFAAAKGTYHVGQEVRVVHREEFPAVSYIEGTATGPGFALAIGGGLGVLFIVLGAFAIPALGRLGRGT